MSSKPSPRQASHGTPPGVAVPHFPLLYIHTHIASFHFFFLSLKHFTPHSLFRLKHFQAHLALSFRRFLLRLRFQLQPKVSPLTFVFVLPYRIFTMSATKRLYDPCPFVSFSLDCSPRYACTHSHSPCLMLLCLIKLLICPACQYS